MRYSVFGYKKVHCHNRSIDFKPRDYNALMGSAVMHKTLHSSSEESNNSTVSITNTIF